MTQGAPLGRLECLIIHQKWTSPEATRFELSPPPGVSVAALPSGNLSSLPVAAAPTPLIGPDRIKSERRLTSCGRTLDGLKSPPPDQDDPILVAADKVETKSKFNWQFVCPAPALSGSRNSCRPSLDHPRQSGKTKEEKSFHPTDDSGRNSSGVFPLESRRGRNGIN